MVIHQKTLKIDTVSNRPSYHNITEEVKEVLAESGIRNGIVVVQSPPYHLLRVL